MFVELRVGCKTQKVARTFPLFVRRKIATNVFVFRLFIVRGTSNNVAEKTEVCTTNNNSGMTAVCAPVVKSHERPARPRLSGSVERHQTVAASQL